MGEFESTQSGTRNWKSEIATNLVSGIWALASSLTLLEFGLEVWKVGEFGIIQSGIGNEESGIRNQEFLHQSKGVSWLYLAYIDRIQKSLLMNVSLTEKQKEYISSQIEMGDYQNASELVRDALRLHQLYRMRVLDDLQKAIAEGWEGPVSSRSATEIALAKRAELLDQ